MITYLVTTVSNVTIKTILCQQLQPPARCCRRYSIRFAVGRCLFQSYAEDNENDIHSFTARRSAQKR